MSDLTRRRLKDIADLSRKRSRDATGKYLAEGVRAVESAVSAGAPVVEVLVTPELIATERVRRIFASSTAPIHMVSQKDLSRVADTRSAQGIIAVIETRQVPVENMAGPVVALDGVQDPGNVGAIIRTAAWFGVQNVVVGEGSADPFGPKAVRASMGGLWDVNVALVVDLRLALGELRERGQPVFGADLQGNPLSVWAPPSEGVLLLGSEAHGIRREIRERVDEFVRIGGGFAVGVESLNVTVAAGILLNHWRG
jgi:RNA methyltransferase, TrmH family